MTRSYYECNFVNDSNSDVIESYECTSEYCLYCRNSQCCLILQRRPPRHLWEAWYFWLGVALLAVFLVFSVQFRSDKIRRMSTIIDGTTESRESISREIIRIIKYL